MYKRIELDRNIIDLSEFFKYFPNQNYYDVIKDTLLHYFSHLEFIRIKVIKAFLREYSIVLRKNYNIEEDFSELTEILNNYNGWFICLVK